MRVAAFFADDIELVEEQYARNAAHVIEQAPEALRRLAKEASDQVLVAHGQQRQAEAFRNRFRKRRLPITWGAAQEDAMARFDTVRPKQVCAKMLLQKVAKLAPNHGRQSELGQGALRMTFDDVFLSGLHSTVATVQGRDTVLAVAIGLGGPCQAISQGRILLGALLRRQRIDRRTQQGLVTGNTGAHQRQ